MEIICTRVTWNVNRFTWRPGPLYPNEKDAVEVSTSNEDDELLLNHIYVEPAHAGVQLMIDSFPQMFVKTSLEYRIIIIAETEVFSLLETAYKIDAKKENVHVFKLWKCQTPTCSSRHYL